MPTLENHSESLCLIYVQAENTGIYTRCCLSRTVQHIHLSIGRAHWAEKDGDEGEWGATKVQKVTCCGLHDHGTERSG